MGKQSRKRKDSRVNKEGWVTTTLIRFGEPNEFGEVFTSDTQCVLPDGTVVEKGEWYSVDNPKKLVYISESEIRSKQYVDKWGCLFLPKRR